MLRKAFEIGDVKIRTPFVLAPLAGITDKTMRSLCMKQGASLVYTEMVSGKGLWYGDKKTDKLLEIGEEEKFVAFQIFGSDPEVMGFAAKYLNERGNVILDLNVGCPVPKIVKNGDGSALLKKLDQLYDVVRAMVKNSQKPVTAKIRKGFERYEDTSVETSRMLESAGVAAITVHGRTREQYYEGKSDWDTIAKVKKSVKIPVIGNGDVMSGQEAVSMIEKTGCDGVMIARGALGNPWIFREANALWNKDEIPPAPSSKDRINMLLNHLAMLAADKGDKVAVREIRKHVGWYVKGMKGAAGLRRRVNRITELAEMYETIKDMVK